MRIKKNDSSSFQEYKAINIKDSFHMAARKVAKIRNTPLWPIIKPLYSLMKKAIDFEFILGMTSKISEFEKAKTALELESKLWGGFSRYALCDLEELRRSPLASADDQCTAAWALARWYTVQKDYSYALECLNYFGNEKTPLASKKGEILLKSDCLVRLGYQHEARRLLDNEFERRVYDPDLCLAHANTYLPIDGLTNSPDLDGKRLKWINRIFINEGFAPLGKEDPGKALTIDNIIAPDTKCLSDNKLPKLSVIIPVYNAESTIGVALKGLVNQTWRNLEIIVVDDCSTDQTYDLVKEYARQDKRIIPIVHDHNQGAYAARNTGLLYARGDFITTHDSDDWSHPQKLETQVKALLADSNAVASVTHWARVTKDLRFTGPWRPANRLIGLNHSSFMITREALNALGRWDRVRITGDIELIWRATKIFGEDAILNIYEKVPFSFSLHDENSLTQHKATHVKTIHYGLRREYRESASWWHSNTLDKSALKLDLLSKERPFPAPALMLSERTPPKRYDLVFVMDYCLIGGAFCSVYNYILAAVRSGKRVALFHWRRYDLKNGNPIQNLIRKLIFEGLVDILVPGMEIVTETVIIGYPVILSYRLDEVPDIKCNKLAVIINQFSCRLYNGEDAVYDPLVIRRNLLETFGMEGKWVPISGLVRRLMASDLRYPVAHHENWFPLVDGENLMSKKIRWRGAVRKTPVIGRHSRDHYTKWLTDELSLRHAYLVDSGFEVRLLGGAKHALSILGEEPVNWKIFKFDTIDVYEFLQDLDFFIHFPHEGYIEEFGRSVIEAMAVGCPVILPPVFYETFGEAAVYCKPKDVAATVGKLWANKVGYLEQVEKGCVFVRENCGLDQLEMRLERL